MKRKCDIYMQKKNKSLSTTHKIVSKTSYLIGQRKSVSQWWYEIDCRIICNLQL